jgi:uncharacterized membrane protein YfcA
VDANALPDIGTILLLCLAAATAGWVDAVTGGGGLLQLPAILVGVPQASAAQALGTNKISGVFGTGAAAITYARKVTLDFRTAIPMAVVAFGGALIGASTARLLPAEVFRPVIVVLLIAVWFWTLLSPQMGAEDNLRWKGTRRHYVIAIVAGGVIGFYDGILGPGTGSFLLIVLVAGLGYSFLSASVTAKIVNLGTNIAAIAVFGLTGSILWTLGLLMALCNVSGAIVGARTALTRGSGFVRAVFLVVVALLIIRLSVDVFQA